MSSSSSVTSVYTTAKQQTRRGGARATRSGSFVSSTGSSSSSSSSSSSASSTSSSFNISVTNKGLLNQQVSGLRMNNGRIVPAGGASISNAQEACRSVLNTPRPDLNMTTQQEMSFGQELYKKQTRQQQMMRALQMDVKMIEFRLVSLVDEAANYQERRGGAAIGSTIRQDQIQNGKLNKPSFGSGNKNRAFMLTGDLVKHIRNDIRTLLYDDTMTPTGAAEPSYAMKQIHGLNLFLESTYGLTE